MRKLPPPPEEVTTEKTNSNKKSKDESSKVAAPESAVMSIAGGGTSSSVTGGVFSNPQAVSVSQVGAAQFSYPIAVPPGRNGLQPNVSLQYSSYNENGWVGVGWDLDLGSIKRSTKNGLNYSGTDFVANGSELVANTTWGANYYCEKIEGAFTKYQFVSNSWLVTTKDGTMYFYGQTASSRMASGTNTYSLQLDRVEDTNGNYMEITYTTPDNNNQIYPNVISYTGKTGGLSTNKTVEFGLADRPDIIRSYKTKYRVTTGKRLQTITVKVDSTTVYKYILNYDNSGPNGRSRLTQIKQVNPSNESNNLPTTDFTWSNGGDGTFGLVNTLSLNGSAGGTIVFGDIDGDGREDFIKAYSTGTNPYVIVYPYLANVSSTGVFSFIAKTAITLAKCPTNSMSVALGDINGDGKADIVSNGLNGQAHAYLSNGNGTFSTVYTTTGSSVNTLFLADLNGDGKADLLKYQSNINVSTGTAYTALSNGNGYFSAPTSTTLPTISNFNPLYHANNFTISVGDVNGDGIPDLFSQSRVSFNPMYFPLDMFANVYGVLIGNGSGGFGSTYFYQEMTQAGLGTGKLADVNGDGLADLVFNDPSNVTQIFLSTGTGMASSVFSIWGTSNFAMADLNDDGMTDMVFESSGENYIRKSLGDGILQWPPIPLAGGPTGTIPVILADINGDGRADMIKYYGTSVSYSMANGANTGDQIKSMINPLGGKTDITYGNSSGLTNNKCPFILHPVTAVNAYADINASPATTTFSYSNAYYKNAEKDFRGFGTVTQKNPDSTTVTTTYEQLDDYKKGRPLLVEMKNPSGDLLNKITLTWENYGSGFFRFVKLANKRTDIYGITNVYTNEAYTYNNTHGGVLQTVKSGTGVTIPWDCVALNYTYINASASGWVWRKASENVGNMIYGLGRQTNYTYDELGNLLTKTYSNNQGLSPEEKYTYDAYGNVSTYQNPKNNNLTLYNYDSTFTHVSEIIYPTTSGVGHSVSMIYHPVFEKIEYEYDENDNETHYYYDAYGRVNQIDYPGYPDGGQTLYTYSDTIIPLSYPIYVKTSVRETTSGYVESWQYVDGFGRGIMGVSKGAGSTYVVTRQFYDNMGRNYYSAGPYHTNTFAYSHTAPATFPTSSKTYDYMSRVIGIFTPIYGNTNMNQFNTTAVSYNGFITTITDAKGNTREEETDYLGRIIRVQEDAGGGTTTYTYNAAGDLISVTDAESNVTTINYNTLGQKTSMSDPDMGSWSYAYDLNGNLYQQIDAKYQIISFAYDELNRVTLKDNPSSDPDVYYSYDTGGNGIGRLYSVKRGYNPNNPDNNTTYNSYDSMGRVLSVTKTIAGDQARETWFAYDYSGKTISTRYPDGYYVYNTYHEGSNLLNTVSGSDGVTYALINNYSPSGKMKILSHGNNTTDTYTYDARSEKLSDVLTASNVSGIIQQKHYEYTAIGEISTITDQHNGISYGYTYDKVGRLTNETTNGTSSMTIAYNAIGNITSKTVGGNTFTYSYNDNNHKHAVTGITYNGTPYSYTYNDANGNMTYGTDFTNLGNIQARTITYNADNMPIQVSHSSNITTQLTYGGTGERVKKRVYSGGNVTDTYYIGDHFEVKGGETIKYIFAGNLRVAQVKGANTRSFFHKDHLGSSTVMTDCLRGRA